VLLLVDERQPPRRMRLPWRVFPATSTMVALFVVAATVEGPAGALAALGALIAFFRALDRALPYKQGLREHRQ